MIKRGNKVHKAQDGLLFVSGTNLWVKWHRRDNSRVRFTLPQAKALTTPIALLFSELQWPLQYTNIITSLEQKSRGKQDYRCYHLYLCIVFNTEDVQVLRWRWRHRWLNLWAHSVAVGDVSLTWRRQAVNQKISPCQSQVTELSFLHFTVRRLCDSSRVSLHDVITTVCLSVARSKEGLGRAHKLQLSWIISQVSHRALMVP